MGSHISDPQKKMSKDSKNNHGTHHRGPWLTFLLVVMALHGLFATYFFYTSRMNDAYISRPWLLTLMAIHSLANVIAAAGIWNWKMWGWQLYVVSGILSLIVGLVSVGIWSVFYMVLPLAIVGWALRTKWNQFT